MVRKFPPLRIINENGSISVRRPGGE